MIVPKTRKFVVSMSKTDDENDISKEFPFYVKSYLTN